MIQKYLFFIMVSLDISKKILDSVSLVAENPDLYLPTYKKRIHFCQRLTCWLVMSWPELFVVQEPKMFRSAERFMNISSFSSLCWIVEITLMVSKKKKILHQVKHHFLCQFILSDFQSD